MLYRWTMPLYNGHKTVAVAALPYWCSCVACSWSVVGRRITATGMVTVTSAALCQCLQSFTVLCQCPAVQCTETSTAVFAWGPLAYVIVLLYVKAVVFVWACKPDAFAHQLLHVATKSKLCVNWIIATVTYDVTLQCVVGVITGFFRVCSWL